MTDSNKCAMIISDSFMSWGSPKIATRHNVYVHWFWIIKDESISGGNGIFQWEGVSIFEDQILVVALVLLEVMM